MNQEGKIKFRYVNKTTGEMVGTPCACDRQTATIYINPPLYSKLPPFERKFWILHEKGHIVLDTPDELKADKYAFDKLAGTEWRSLKQMIGALEHLLDSSNEFHQERIDHIYKLALQWDKTHPVLNGAIIDGDVLKEINADNNQTFKNLASLMGQMMVLNKTTTEESVQKKDNTLVLILLAVGAMYIFTKFINN